MPGAEPLPTSEVAPGTELRVVIPPDLLSQVIQEGLTFGESFAQSRIEGVAKLAGLSQGEINPQLRQAEIGSSRKELVAKLMPMALQEWGLDAEMSPTAAIGVLLVPWGFGALTAYLTLAKLAEDRQKREIADGNSGKGSGNP